MNPTGHNHTYGHCHNPWQLDHAPGGSSSGSAAAVAARCTFASLGTDTGGSVRVPAAACGVTGLKTTQMRVSRSGVAPFSSFSYETVGPLARSAQDVAMVLTVIAGRDAADPTSADIAVPDYVAALDGDLRGQRIGVAERDLFPGTDRAIEEAVRTALDVLVARGAQLVSIELPALDTIAAYSGVIGRVEMAAAFGPLIDERGGDFSDLFRTRMLAGRLVPATHYVEALSMRGAILAQYLDEVFDRVDVIAAPMIRRQMPTLDQSDIDFGSEEDYRTAQSISVNARPFNFLGLPAISVPCGFDDIGLPIGLQLAGRPFGEARLLRIADALQRDTDWHRQTRGAGLHHLAG